MSERLKSLGILIAVILALEMSGAEHTECLRQVMGADRGGIGDTNAVKVLDAILEGCPLMASNAIKDIKRKSLNQSKELISYLEAEYLKKFDPLAWFDRNPTSENAFLDAFMFAKDNRDYDIAKSILEKIPPALESANPTLKKELLFSVQATEKHDVGSVFISNRMAKVFARFPCVAGSFISPQGVFRVEWEEHFGNDSKLYLVDVRTGKKILTFENLTNVQVLWSRNGQYLAIRNLSRKLRDGTHLHDKDSTSTGDLLANDIVREMYVKMVDLKQPGVVWRLDDYLPKSIIEGSRDAGFSYFLQEWTDHDALRVYATWGYDVKTKSPSNGCVLTVSFTKGSGLKVDTGANL